jgi:hypothetical protein
VVNCNLELNICIHQPTLCNQKGGVLLTANTIKPLTLYRDPISDLRSCTHIAGLPKYLILSTDPMVYTLRIRNTQRQTDLRKSRLLSSFVVIHTDSSQRTIPFNVHKSIYTREHKLSIRLYSQNFSSFDQTSHCLSPETHL